MCNFSIKCVFCRRAVSAESSVIDYERCKSIVETVVKTFDIFKPEITHLKKIVAFSYFFDIAKNAYLVGT